MADALRRLAVNWLPAICQPFGIDRAVDLALSKPRRQDAALTLIRKVRTRPQPPYSDTELLDAERAFVPFDEVNRDPDFSKLRDWCENRDLGPAAWRLVTGPAGRGKTRLGMHLIEMLTADGGDWWQGGFVHLPNFRLAPEKALYLGDLQGDLLLVVDYAERFREHVVALGVATRALAELDPKRRIRLLLISRRNADVWRHIGDDERLVAEFLERGGMSEQRLEPLVGDVADRPTIFRAAYDAFIPHVESAPAIAEIEPPDLSAPAFTEALMIHAAALYVARGGDWQRASDHEHVLGTILGRERRLWNQAVMDRSGLANTLRDAPIRQAAECLTLVSLNEGVASRDRTSALLGACPRLAGLDAATLGAIADIFHELYEREERDDWARGVTPDLLGTFLLRETDDGLLRNLFSTTILSDREATNALTKLNWLAQEWPEAGRAKLLSAFAADPARLLPLAMQVAIESSDPIGGLAAAHLQSHPDIDLAREIDRSMPHRTTALRELATVATELLHGSAGRDDLDDMAERAGTANNLSVRLSDLGRREEALAAVEEAVALYRELATARPDAFRPDLATALTNLSNRLSDLERREEALAAVTEAVAIRRDLATARPDAFRPDLAMSLNNLAGDLSLLGRREEALAAVAEAVALYRDLATARPDAFRPDLAGTLNNLSIFQSDLGRREEALAAVVEAVALTRDLATARPDAFRPVLAMSLYNLALSSNEAGRREEAVLAARQAVDLYHGLVQVYPDAFGDNLADAQGLLSELGEETDGG